MKINKTITIITALLLSIGFTGCKKKGCTDSSAVNFDVTADKNDGTCYYPSQAKITFVSIQSFPTVDDNGNSWDTTDNADPFIRIEDENDNILYQTEPYTNLSPPLTWSVTPNLTISNLDQYLTIFLYDEDGTTDQYMGLSTLNLNDNTVNGFQSDKYPYTIETTYAGYTFRLSVEWVE